MKTLADKIDVMQAADAGAPIQIWDGGEWVDCRNPTWDWFRCVYRVKGDPKRVPLGPEDVPPGSAFRWDCWRCQQEHQDSWAAIGFVGRYGITVQVAFNSAPTALKWDTIADGGEISRDGGKTWGPCSKEVEA